MPFTELSMGMSNDYQLLFKKAQLLFGLVELSFTNGE